MNSHRNPREMLRRAMEWAAETGWISMSRDRAIADGIYKKWVQETDSEWLLTQNRDRELLSDALYSAYRTIHPDPVADHIYVLVMVELEIRGRREGILSRNRDH